MPLPDFVHGLFVLLASASYILPAYEGAISRKSPFYTSLFFTLLFLSVSLHAEEFHIGLSNFPPAIHERLQSLSNGFSYFLLNVMLLVVLEVHSDVLGRVLAGVWALSLSLLGWSSDPSMVLTNILSSVVISLITLILDVAIDQRKFTRAYWQRLILIGAMGLVGAGLFRLLKVLWVFHGVWHIYASITTYLLLVAQRTKVNHLLLLQSTGGGSGSGSGSGGSSQQGKRSGSTRTLLGAGGGGGYRRSGHSSNVDTLTTPTKRVGKGGGDNDDDTLQPSTSDGGSSSSNHNQQYHHDHHQYQTLGIGAASINMPNNNTNNHHHTMDLGGPIPV